VKADRHFPSKELIKLNHLNLDFVSEIEKISGVNINKCYHCKTCAGGCHFYQTTDYPPNSVIRLAQLGLRNEALDGSVSAAIPVRFSVLWGSTWQVLWMGCAR
jgi:heterodisulfide reductase subunit C